MSVRISSDASALKRSANAPLVSSYTFGGWFKFGSVTPARFWGPLGLYDGTDGVPTAGTSFQQLSSIASASATMGLTYKVLGATQTDTVFTLKAGFWTFLAMSGAGSAAGDVKAYTRLLHEKAFTVGQNSTAISAPFVATRFEYGRDAFTGDFMDGVAQHCFAFDRVLDAGELMKLSIAMLYERRFPDSRNLNVYYRLRGANDIVDLSGNARQLTATIGANAERLQRWVRRKSRVPAAAASGAMAGTTTITLGQTGALVGAGGLTGTAAITLSPTGTLRGAGALQGNNSLTFSQAGALLGAGALSGSTTITFAHAADLKATGALSGSTTLTFSQSGTLDVPSGAMVGTATVTFSQAGALGATGALAGSSALTFSQSGALLAIGNLAGSTSIVFAPVGTITGAGALAGTAPLTFNQSGTLDVPAGTMTGTAAITLGQAGALTASATLAGSSSIVFGQSGTLVDLNAPVDVPAVATPGFFYYYEEHERQRRRARRELEERERETQEIQDELDREIAELLRVQEAKDAKRAELARLQRLADAFAAQPVAMPPQVLESIRKAIERRTFDALQRMQREVEQMLLEEENAAVMAAVMLDDD